MRVYFDNAATTPLDPEVIKVMHEVMQTHFGNPSSASHMEGKKSRALIDTARKKVATLLGVTPGEIFFTSGGTEAHNMAIRCAVEDLNIRHIITTRIEHHAVLHSIEACEKKGVEVHHLTLHPDGHVNLEELEALLPRLSKDKVLVSLMHANNEIGNLLDVEKVGALCRQHGAYFHCDMVQTFGHLPVDLKKAGVHFTAASAHKFNGPKGVGFIYVDSSIKLTPFIQGGAQERNMRGGTENLYGIVGLAKALEICYAEMDEQTRHIQGLKDYMIERLEETIPGVTFNGDAKGRSLYTVLNVSLPPNPVAEMLLFTLDIEGIAASGGSACTSGSDVGSHVLAELPEKKDHSNVRFSFGKYNTKEEVDFVVAKLKEILKLETVGA